MDKVFLGLDCASLDKGIESEAITKVEILNNDGEIVGQAGTTTGKTLTVTNPGGNNTMASYILSQVSGYVQRGYNASRAIIDPAAELGDGVTVGGIYSVIASENINYDALYTSDISAPDADEVDDEYPYQTYQQRVERKVAGAYSKITKTASEIRLEVADVEDNVSALTVEVGEISSEVSGKIDDEEAQSLIDQTLSEITLSVSSGSGGSSISLTSNGVTVTSSSVNLHVKSANIDGTITADEIRGSTFSLLDDDDDDAATFYLTGASSTTVPKIVIESGAIDLQSTSGDIFLGTYGYGLISALRISSDNDELACSGDFLPNANNTYDLGRGGLYWKNIYCYNSAVDLSDRNEKTDISYGLNIDGFFDRIKPASFKMLHGTSGRTHYGMIAQDVEEAMTASGFSSVDFAGLVKSKDDNGNDIYGLRYGEFISLCIDQIQKLKARVKALEGTA